MPHDSKSQSALDAFIARRAEIDQVRWGHAVTLAHYAPLLRRIADTAFREGEHAA